MTFEEILGRLDEISSSLESGSLPLEKGIELYGEGLSLSKQAIEILKDGKGKITLLNDELGKLADETFEVEQDD